MTWTELAKQGFKILMALAAALAVWKGVSKAMEYRTNPIPQPPVDPSKPSISGTIMTGLHETRDTCGKVTAVLGAVTATADAVYTIFGNGQGGYSYGQPGGFSRVSPFIVSAGQGGINTNPGYRI